MNVLSTLLANYKTLCMFVCFVWAYNVFLPHMNAAYTDFVTIMDCIYNVHNDEEEDTVKEKELNDLPELVPLPKYEDKYLEDIRKLKKEWEFTEKDLEMEQTLCQDFLELSRKELQSEIEKNRTEIELLQKEMAVDVDSIDSIEIKNDENHETEIVEDTTLEERNEYRKDRIALLKDAYNNNCMQLEDHDTLRKNAETYARNIMINQRISNLKTNFIMEKTPLGNVLMVYNKESESFKYYADSSIPYRYLEPVARKYVKTFQCRPLFVDMEEELKLVEEKWTKEYEMKKKLEAEKQSVKKSPDEKKKNVFAKFKHYNKDAGGTISMAPPPKNNISRNATTISSDTKENEKILLKDRANRYTYEGKLANFNFLQKVERKVFNKKLALTFSDFKKLQKQSTTQSTT